MKLNVGCGKQTWDGYICIDAVVHPNATRPPDILHAFRFARDGTLLNPLPITTGVASEICNFHFIEHVYQWEAPAVIAEFFRILQPGGVLIMELPDLKMAARNLLKGAKDQLCMWPLYGDPATHDPYMCHRWGYTRETITDLLESAGFNQITHKPPQTHGARLNRDMRVEAIR